MKTESKTTTEAPEKSWCENCGKKLDNKKIVWLELSNTDSQYYEAIPPGHVSQGCFSFGSDCAKTVLKETEVSNRTLISEYIGKKFKTSQSYDKAIYLVSSIDSRNLVTVEWSEGRERLSTKYEVGTIINFIKTKTWKLQ